MFRPRKERSYHLCARLLAWIEPNDREVVTIFAGCSEENMQWLGRISSRRSDLIPGHFGSHHDGQRYSSLYHSSAQAQASFGFHQLTNSAMRVKTGQLGPKTNLSLSACWMTTTSCTSCFALSGSSSRFANPLGVGFSVAFPLPFLEDSI